MLDGTAKGGRSHNPPALENSLIARSQEVPNDSSEEKDKGSGEDYLASNRYSTHRNVHRAWSV